MPLRPLLPLPDYQRIYQVAYSVLEASGVATTHRACMFFASVGAMIMRTHYRLPATISAGCLALMVNERKAQVVVYGREEDDGSFANDERGFHAWVECDGWLIDFMAPIMGDALRKDGRDWVIPRYMLQKRLESRMPTLGDIQHVGDFFVEHDSALAGSLVDGHGQMAEDLMDVCLSWFRRPPRSLKAMALGGTHGEPIEVKLRAPFIEGVW